MRMQKEIISSRQLHVTLERLVCQIVENHKDFSQTAIIGIQRRGVILAGKIAEILRRDYGIENLRLGSLDTHIFPRRLPPARRTAPGQYHQHRLCGGRAAGHLRGRRPVHRTQHPRRSVGHQFFRTAFADRTAGTHRPSFQPRTSHPNPITGVSRWT